MSAVSPEEIRNAFKQLDYTDEEIEELVEASKWEDPMQIIDAREQAEQLKEVMDELKKGDNNMTKAEEFSNLFYDISRQLENARESVYQEETIAWDENRADYIDCRLYELRNNICGIADIVKKMSFESDSKK